MLQQENKDLQQKRSTKRRISSLSEFPPNNEGAVAAKRDRKVAVVAAAVAPLLRQQYQPKVRDKTKSL
jgi:hypothetical protein